MFLGKLDHQAFQNGEARRHTGAEPSQLHIGFGHDDARQLAIREDEESVRTAVAAALPVGHAVPLRHARGGGLRPGQESSAHDAYHYGEFRGANSEAGVQCRRRRCEASRWRGNQPSCRLYGVPKW